MKTWKVWESGLTTLYIIACDSDEALKQARKINPNYNTIQLYSIEKEMIDDEY